MNLPSSLEVTDQPGTYVLVFQSSINKRLTIGRLGALDVVPGFYLYIGSAFGPGGLRARTGRHRRKNTVKRWHIDTLKSWIHLAEIWFTEDPVHREHQWAGWFASDDEWIVPLPGFGSSDCRCPGHLFHAAAPPDFNRFSDRQSMTGGEPAFRVVEAPLNR